MNKNKSKHYFKIIIVGDASVGKSSLISRFVDNSYRNDYVITLGVDFVL